MFMNAQPRDVSHSFETFVPFSYSQNRPRRGLCEMSNNELNAWGGQRSVLQSHRSYAQNSAVYDCNGDENSSSSSRDCLYTPELPPNQIHSSTTNYSRNLGSQIKYSQTPLVARNTPLSYIPSNSYGTCINNFGVTNQNSTYRGLEWSVNAGLYTPATATAYSYVTRTPINTRTINSLPSSSYRTSNSSTTSEGFASDANSPSSIYSCYSPIPTFAPDLITGPFTALDVQDDSVNRWWAGLSGQTGDVDALAYTNNVSCDGLTREFSTWVPDVAPTVSYAQGDQYGAPFSTVSPDVLYTVQNVPLQTSVNYDSPSSSRQPSMSDATMSSSSSSIVQGLSSSIDRRPRRKLPSQPVSHKLSIVSRSADSRGSKAERLANSTTATSLRPEVSEMVDRDIASKKGRNLQDLNDSDDEGSVHDTASKMSDTDPCQSTTATPVTSSNRDLKDDFLVRSKLAGMSYKDIRRKGGFIEAESTLRGRFRTLTKDKEERVRRPAWSDNDVNTYFEAVASSFKLGNGVANVAQIRLLKRGIRKLAHSSDIARAKIPWKKVAEYIYRNGGSYQFGNATCRKKWDLIQDRNSS